MRTLSAELLNLIVVFQPLFTKPTWEYAKLLLLGALLQRGKRTVTACLRVVGLSQEEHFQNYHRVLNRASWSATLAARILLGLIILTLAAGSGQGTGRGRRLRRYQTGSGLRQLEEYDFGDALLLECRAVSSSRKDGPNLPWSCAAQRQTTAYAQSVGYAQRHLLGECQN